jgi:hypothetical protein
VGLRGGGGGEGGRGRKRKRRNMLGEKKQRHRHHLHRRYCRRHCHHRHRHPYRHHLLRRHRHRLHPHHRRKRILFESIPSLVGFSSKKRYYGSRWMERRLDLLERRRRYTSYRCCISLSRFRILTALDEAVNVRRNTSYETLDRRRPGGRDGGEFRIRFLSVHS